MSQEFTYRIWPKYHQEKKSSSPLYFHPTPSDKITKKIFEKQIKILIMLDSLP